MISEDEKQLLQRYRMLTGENKRKVAGIVAYELTMQHSGRIEITGPALHDNRTKYNVDNGTDGKSK